MKVLKILNEWKGLIICVLLWALMIAVWACAEPSPLDDITFGGVVILVVAAILLPVIWELLKKFFIWICPVGVWRGFWWWR